MAVPEMIHSAEVYQLYRGACGKEGDLVAEKCRIWVDFPNLRIAIAEYDQPASPRNCISLLDISWCHCETKRPSPNQTPRIRVHGSSSSLQGFGLALQKLLKSRDEEGRGRLYFIQRRLFQYLPGQAPVSEADKEITPGQVITRILEYFAESYFQQWQVDPKAVEPVTAYASADTVAVSLIMLNTGLHVAAKKLGNKAKGASMSLEEYIANTRRLVPAEEVPDEALRAWFEDISCTEISVEPMPRTPDAFDFFPLNERSNLTCDIACFHAQNVNLISRLIAVVKNTSLRFWAVLVLQRIYLFSDSQGDVDPADVIDLKDVAVTTLEEDPEARKRYLDNLPGARRSFCCRRRRPDPWFLAASRRALEISQRSSGPPAILQKSCKKAMRRLVLVAESADLAEKWVHMISCGP
eukprot:g31187.t1